MAPDRQPHTGVLHLYRTLLAFRQSEQQLQPEAFAMDAHTVALYAVLLRRG